MNSVPPAASEEVIQRVAALVTWLNAHVPQGDGEGTLVRSGLADPTKRRATLLLLSLLAPERTEPVIDHVIRLATSDRDALLVRQLLGRLSWHRSRQLVPPVVDVVLDSADDHDYRRLAELLDYLGLPDALEGLCERAAASLDEGIKEVSREFGR